MSKACENEGRNNTSRYAREGSALHEEKTDWEAISELADAAGESDGKLDELIDVIFPVMVSRLTDWGLSEHERDEIAQSVLVKLFENREKYDSSIGPFRNYFLTILSREKKDYFRRLQRERDAVTRLEKQARALQASAPAAGDLVEQKEAQELFNEQVDECRKQFTRNEEMAFVHCVLEEKSRKELAEKLGVKDVTVRTWLYRARCKIEAWQGVEKED